MCLHTTCVFVYQGRKDPSDSLNCLNLIDGYLCSVFWACDQSHRTVPTGRRFHGRTFRRQILSICPLEYAIVWTFPYNSPSLGHARMNSCATLAQVICQRSRIPLNFERKSRDSRGTKFRNAKFSATTLLFSQNS